MDPMNDRITTPRVYRLSGENPPLDAAWAEVEAALPDGWSILPPLSLRSFGGYWRAAADAPSLVGLPWHERHVLAHGLTPAAALLALAAALRDGRTK